jgi:DNA-binding XRE family transcriptional regulator
MEARPRLDGTGTGRQPGPNGRPPQRGPDYFTRPHTGIDLNLAMGRRLKTCRKRLGLSQQQLAAIIQTSQSCISLWENGVNGASIAFFFQLADALGVDARWLATGRSYMVGRRK